jgi:hypothetical protein
VRFLVLPLAAALVVLSGATAHAAPPVVAPPQAAAPGSPPLRLAQRRLHALPRRTAVLPGSTGGPIATATGERFTLMASPAYAPDAARDAQWAAFFAGLPHGPELAALKVYFAPRGEVAGACGAGANACYVPSSHEMVLSGDGVNADGSAVTEAARHEYGHHLAAASVNSPFPSDLGTRRWFTRMRVCSRVATGEYSLDPGADYASAATEGFAEAYRVASGGDASSWEIVSRAFYPDGAARRAILADAAFPWQGRKVTELAGRLTRRRARIAIPVPLDGDVEVELRTSGALVPEAALTSASGATTYAHARGRRDVLRLRVTACGQRRMTLALRAGRGAGAYTVRIARP